MSKSENADSGCFAGVLRLLLCKGSAPTYPSEKIADPVVEFETKSEAPPEPGLVARLMGLESNWVPQPPPPSRVSRSKSVNFVDYLLKFDCSEAEAGARHRRVRTSASFREVPPLLNQKKDIVIVCLSGDGDGDGDGLRKASNIRKLEVGLRVARQEKKQKEQTTEIMKQKSARTKTKLTQKKNNKISNLKDEPRRNARNQTSRARKRTPSKDLGTVNPKQHPQKPPLKSPREASAGSKLSKKGKNQYEIRFPEIANSKTGSKFSSAGDEPELKATKKKDNNLVGSRKADENDDMVAKLYRLTEKDIRESKWATESATEFEEICMELEHQILHVQLFHVLHEIV